MTKFPIVKKRVGTWETNSSSSHSLVLYNKKLEEFEPKEYKKIPLDISNPDAITEIDRSCGSPQFGWGVETLVTEKEKACYAFSLYAKNYGGIDWIKDFFEVEDSPTFYDDAKVLLDSAHLMPIDHQSNNFQDCLFCGVPEIDIKIIYEPEVSILIANDNM